MELGIFKLAFRRSEKGVKSAIPYPDGIKGGVIAGFLLALLVILSRRVSGFQQLELDYFRRLWPLMIFIGTVGGALAGFLCCRYAGLYWSQTRLWRRYLYAALLFSWGFAIAFFVQQLSARDAFGPPGWYAFADRMGGGPAGEPNFESLATGLLGGVFFLFLSRSMARRKSRHARDLLQTSIKVAVPGVVVWSFVYLIYVLAIALKITQQDKVPWRSSAIFIVDFPHPERVLLHTVIGIFFAASILHFSRRAMRATEEHHRKRDQDFLDKAAAILADNLDDPGFGPQKLADALHISKGHLNRKLNAMTQMTTRRYILISRLEKAAVLLEQDADTVSRIAFDVGFNNLSYFNKSFKQHFEVTPSEYKRKRMA
ncbi:AraC family transcriptional regulator [candidate division KSB1 bacterium]|nr:MAG: AraC family transcriptional regulator [candidate division KSB1 bacterium]